VTCDVLLVILVGNCAIYPWGGGGAGQDFSCGQVSLQQVRILVLGLGVCVYGF